MCNIGYMSSDDHMWTTTPKAAKEYRCCECGSIIDKGEKHQLIKGIWDGTWDKYRTCEFCASVRDKSHDDFNFGHDEGIAFGDLWECVGSDYAAVNV